MHNACFEALALDLVYVALRIAPPDLGKAIRGLALVGIRPISDSEDPFVGFTSRYPLFEESQAEDGTLVFATVRNKLKFFNYQEFARHKPDGTYRIFCMGGSTTYGRPYQHETSFCGWLESLLPVADPSRRAARRGSQADGGAGRDASDGYARR